MMYHFDEDIKVSKQIFYLLATVLNEIKIRGVKIIQKHKLFFLVEKFFGEISIAYHQPLSS